MKSVCNATKEASNLYVGDYASYSSLACGEVTLADGECINDITTFSYNGFVAGFGYNTTLGKSGAVGASSLVSTWNDFSAYDSIRSPMGNARSGAGNDTATQTCLTSIGISESSSGGIVNLELYYNTEIPNYNSSTCDNQRNPIDINLDGLVAAAAGLLIFLVILGICCCGCVLLAVWFFCCRRTGSAGSRNEDNQRPSTPEKQAEVHTTTIIQQPAMMAPVMQQPMMQQPMMM